MDTNDEEKTQGKTVEVGCAQFETPNRRFTILDVPGHKSYVPNMIAGASQADIGVLLVSARKDEFETGFERGGQTREHALLTKTLDVENIKERMDTSPWFRGKTLLDTLDSIEIARSSEESALRMPMLDGNKDMDAIMAVGKVEQGTVGPGMKCMVQPTGTKCSVACVIINDEPVKFAKNCENVTLRITSIAEDDLKKGYVLCPLKESIHTVTKFKVILQVTELTEEQPLMTAGYRSILHAHVATEE